VFLPCGAEIKLRVWYLMFSKSPVRQQVPDHVCKKSDTTIDSQQRFLGDVVGPFLCRGVILTLFQRCGVTPSDRNRWNKSVRRESKTCSVFLLPRSF